MIDLPLYLWLTGVFWLLLSTMAIAGPSMRHDPRGCIKLTVITLCVELVTWIVPPLSSGFSPEIAPVINPILGVVLGFHVIMMLRSLEG
jgi:hypothetical protein